MSDAGGVGRTLQQHPLQGVDPLGDGGGLGSSHRFPPAREP